MTRRVLVVGLSALLVSVVFVVSGVSADAGDVPSGPVSWLSTGDSYSSGEGVYGNAGACAQSEGAWGPAAAARLAGTDFGWTIGPEAFTACTGSLVEDFFNPRDPDKASLYQWGLDLGVPERTDVITLSFGGNDIGFAGIISDCITLPDGWGGEIVTGLSGCDLSEDVINARIDALLDPPNTDCVGGRATNVVDDDPYLCDLLIGPDPGNRGSYVDFLVQLVENNLTRRGRIYLAGYPAITAPTSEWGVWNTFMCGAAQIKRGDAQRLERLAWRLDGALKTAVERANQRLGAERILYVPRFDIFREGSHELCGRGEDWINGLTTTRGQGITFRPSGSFHPNQAGHTATANYLTDNIDLDQQPTRFSDLVGEMFEDPLWDSGIYVMGPSEYGSAKALIADRSLYGDQDFWDWLAISPLDPSIAVTGLAPGQVLVEAWIELYSGDLIPSALVLYRYDDDRGVWSVAAVVSDDDIEQAMRAFPSYATATRDAAPVLWVQFESIDLTVLSLSIRATVTVYDYFMDYEQVFSASVECTVDDAVVCVQVP